MAESKRHGLGEEAYAKLRFLRDEAEDAIRLQGRLLGRLDKLGVRPRLDGTHAVEFRVQRRTLSRETDEGMDRLYKTIRKGRERVPTEPRRAEYPDRESLIRALGHMFENYDAEFSELEQRSAYVAVVRDMARAGEMPAGEAAERISAQIKQLARKTDFRKRAASSELDKARALLDAGNVHAAAAAIVGAINRFGNRRPSVESAVIPKNVERVRLLEEMTRLELKKREVLANSLEFLHGVIGTSVVIRNRAVNSDRFHHSQFAGLASELSGHFNALVPRHAAANARRIAERLDEFHGLPGRLPSHLDAAKGHLFSGRHEAGRDAIQAALGEVKRLRAGKIGWTDRRKLAAFMESLDPLAWRLPRRTQGKILFRVRRAKHGIGETLEDIDVVHQHVREAREALGAV
ncbi:MAG: hypothetical protein V1787_04670 [Candidatus Micrarchaeota archaeon]